MLLVMGERGAIVKSSHLLDGCYLGQLQCTLQPGHGGNLKIATRVGARWKGQKCPELERSELQGGG